MARKRRPRGKADVPVTPPEPVASADAISANGPFEIFLSGTPGLEGALVAEAHALGFANAQEVPGGVTLTGGWPDIWRANLCCRGATRVLVRIASFRALHLAQLDKRARRIAWLDFLRPGQTIKVDTTCRKSKIYHAGAATQRIETAARAALGDENGQAPVRVQARIEDDLCVISLDTSGAPLHIRGIKQAVGKAPMRETLAAMFLHQCGYRGDEPVYDPMCGSGTFVLEAADIAAGRPPGRNRTFAFESFPGFDPASWTRMRSETSDVLPDLRFSGSDRDAGAIGMASENAARAGLTPITAFRQCSVSEATPPEGPPGLVITNPPYGARIGNKKLLFGLYGALGSTLMAQFSGWRVGIVTSDSALARASNLPGLTAGPPIPHGGLKVRLFQTGPLP